MLWRLACSRVCIDDGIGRLRRQDLIQVLHKGPEMRQDLIDPLGVAALLARTRFCARLKFRNRHTGEPRGKFILGFARENQPTFQCLFETISRQKVENRPVAGGWTARSPIRRAGMAPGRIPRRAGAGSPSAIVAALAFAPELHQQDALPIRIASEQVIPYALAKGIKALWST